MPPELQKLLRNKPFLAVAGAVGGVGLFVLYRRTRTGGASTAAAAGGDGAGATGYLGRFDSTGTDVASWLGTQSGVLQSQLDQYARQLQDALAGLRAVPPEATPSPPAPGAGVVYRVPENTTVHPTANPRGPRTVTVSAFTSKSPPWTSTLSGIAGHEGTTVSRLLQLNPGIRNPNIIHPGQLIRVP